MKRSAFLHGVVDCNRDPISPVSLDSRARECIVDNDGTAVDAVRTDDLLADGKVVGSSHAGVGRVLVRICIRTSPWTPRPALWHRSTVAADPGRESSGTGSSKLGLAVGFVLRQPWVEVRSPRQPSRSMAI